MPDPGPVNPLHTPTPSQYQPGAVRRNTKTGAAAVKADHPTADGTLDWAVATTQYGGYYASWDDVGTSEWVDVNVAWLGGEGTLSVTVAQIFTAAAKFAGDGSLTATVGLGVAPQFSGQGSLTATVVAQ
jgi:hypothetical protein